MRGSAPASRAHPLAPWQRGRIAGRRLWVAGCQGRCQRLRAADTAAREGGRAASAGVLLLVAVLVIVTVTPVASDAA